MNSPETAPNPSSNDQVAEIPPIYALMSLTLQNLNHYVGVADAKAGGLAAASLTLAGLILSGKTTDGSVRLLAALSTSLFAAAVVCSALCLVPRMPAGGTGLVFWGDIHRRRTPESYWEDVRLVSAASAAREVTLQCWYVSQVLKAKYKAVSWAFGAFFAAVVVTVLAAFLNRT